MINYSLLDRVPLIKGDVSLLSILFKPKGTAGNSNPLLETQEIRDQVMSKLWAEFQLALIV